MLVKCLSWDVRDVDGKFAVHGFGNNEKGESVYLQVRGYQPYFYVLVDDFDERECRLLKRLNPAIDFAASVVEEKVNFYGFTNGEKRRFLKLVFNTKAAFWATKKVLKGGQVTFRGQAGYPFALFETRLNPILRFFHDTDITTTDTITVTQYAIPRVKTTKCAHEIVCYTPKCLVRAAPCGPIPFRQATIDIETYSWDRRFPDPEHPKNVITHVAIVLKRTTEAEPYAKLVVSNGLWTTPSTKPDICHRIVSSEKALLEQLFTWISTHDPDIIYTYNGDIFDWRYIWVRAVRCRVDIHTISRHPNIRCHYETDQKFESAAYGKNNYSRVTIPGRINLDILIYIRREFSTLPSFSLNNVATHFLDDTKDPVSVLEMFSAYDTKNPELSCTVAEYCVQDTILPQALVDKLNILMSLDAMAGITCVMIPDLLTRGQSAKTLSQLNRKTMAEGYLIPDGPA